MMMMTIISHIYNSLHSFPTLSLFFLSLGARPGGYRIVSPCSMALGTLASLDGAGRSCKPQPQLGASGGILAAPGRGKEIAPCMGSCVRGGVSVAAARGRQVGRFFLVEAACHQSRGS